MFIGDRKNHLRIHCKEGRRLYILHMVHGHNAAPNQEGLLCMCQDVPETLLFVHVTNPTWSWDLCKHTCGVYTFFWNSSENKSHSHHTIGIWLLSSGECKGRAIYYVNYCSWEWGDWTTVIIFVMIEAIKTEKFQFMEVQFQQIISDYLLFCWFGNWIGLLNLNCIR